MVKPFQFIASGSKGLIQPAVKCRGREYLRIIYGPEYTFPENLSRLRQRGLATKRSLALREFALGVEGLERFANWSRCGVSMSASSASWPWRASRSIRDCDDKPVSVRRSAGHLFNRLFEFVVHGDVGKLVAKRQRFYSAVPLTSLERYATCPTP